MTNYNYTQQEKKLFCRQTDRLMSYRLGLEGLTGNAELVYPGAGVALHQILQKYLNH